MNKLILIVAVIVLNCNCLFSQVAINYDGSAANNAAILDLKSNDKGLLLPRLNYAEVQAIQSPPNGLLVYCTDCGPNGLGAMAIFTAEQWYLFNIFSLNP
jgi:hypothetical protein